MPSSFAETRKENTWLWKKTIIRDGGSLEEKYKINSYLLTQLFGSAGRREELMWISKDWYGLTTANTTHKIVGDLFFMLSLFHSCKSQREKEMGSRKKLVG